MTGVPGPTGISKCGPGESETRAGPLEFPNVVKAKGVRLMDEAPRSGAEGLNIAFLHTKSTHGVLTELCEDPNN